MADPMAITSAKLVDGVREMLLFPRADLSLNGLDPGSPQIRAVVEARVDGNGLVDTTRFHGARTLALEFLVHESGAAVLDELGAFLHPRSRPYLVVKYHQWAQTRRLRLRVEAWSPADGVDLPPDVRAVQVQWSVPDGVWEAVEETSLPITADLPSTEGFSAPYSFPLALTATMATGAIQVTGLGTTTSPFTARLYGPCSAPRLINDLTGEEIAFTEALVLGSGQYVEIDTQARTAYLQSSRSQSRALYIDHAVNTWWEIQPGPQQIRYAPTSPSAASEAVLTYRHRWL